MASPLRGDVRNERWRRSLEVVLTWFYEKKAVKIARAHHARQGGEKPRQVRVEELGPAAAGVAGTVDPGPDIHDRSEFEGRRVPILSA